MQKSFKMEQFSIGLSTFYDIFKSKENFKKFKAKKRSLDVITYYALHNIQQLYYFMKKIILSTYPEKCFSGHIN